jgi:hypothetical protein
MLKVKFITKSLFAAKGEERDVTERAAERFLEQGLIAPYKEEKEIPKTKEEKAVVETKEVPEAKLTKGPSLPGPEKGKRKGKK